MFSDYPKELNIKIDDEHYPLKLTKGNRFYQGKRGTNLKHIKWLTYKIENKEDFELEYDNIAVSFSLITKDILKLASDTICQEDVTSAKLPNIDANTGNIHATEENANDPITDPNAEFLQLVLCVGSGPNAPHFTETDDYYYYTGVHKACYYPLIDEEKDKEKLKGDIRQIILKAVWDELHEMKRGKNYVQKSH